MKICSVICASAFVLISCATERVAPLPPSAKSITALLETQPVSSTGDAADDPAIWINSTNAEASLVIGTDKDYGVEVYDLKGKRVQSIAAGRTNNIDLRYLNRHADWSAIAAASNRTNNTITLFGISHSGKLTWLKADEIATGLTEPYGLCMYSDANGIQIFVNDTDGRYQQWLLTPNKGEESIPSSSFSASLVREFEVSSQPEGCVADDEQGLLFLGVEAEGVKVVAASMDEAAQLNSVADIDGVVLAADVEGMSLYKNGSSGYLVVSSQGNYSYSVYDRLSPHSYRGSFYVIDDEANSIDGSQETDGLDVSSILRTTDFPTGLLVVQDGYNTLPNAGQNFKYISWAQVSAALDL